MEEKNENTAYKPSGNKNSYYFLNRLILAHNEDIPILWQNIIKSEPLSTHPIRKDKKYKITSKHWKKTVKSLLSKGSQIQTSEVKTVKFLLELTRSPEKFMRNSNGKEIINWRSKNSCEIFVQKCKNSIYPWLRAMVIDEFSKRGGSDSEGMKDDLLQEILEKQISINEKERNDCELIEQKCGLPKVKMEEEPIKVKKTIKKKQCSCCKEAKKNIDELKVSLAEMKEEMKILMNQNKFMMLCLGGFIRPTKIEKM